MEREEPYVRTRARELKFRDKEGHLDTRVGKRYSLEDLRSFMQRSEEELRQSKLKERDPSPLIIEGPDYLPIDANLYDQEPFASIIENIALQHSVEIPNLRTALTNAIRVADNRSKLQDVPFHEVLNADAFYQGINRLGLAQRVSKQAKYSYREAGMEMFHALEEYPRYGEYLLEIIGGNDYRLDGEVKRKQGWSNSTFIAESYPHWLARESNSVLVGIEEIFPGIHEQISISDAIRSAGGRVPSRHTWTIHRASETSRRNR